MNVYMGLTRILFRNIHIPINICISLKGVELKNAKANICCTHSKYKKIKQPLVMTAMSQSLKHQERGKENKVNSRWQLRPATHVPAGPLEQQIRLQCHISKSHFRRKKMAKQMRSWNASIMRCYLAILLPLIEFPVSELYPVYLVPWLLCHPICWTLHLSSLTTLLSVELVTHFLPV